MNIPKSVKNKIASYGDWALITGASSGIGKALAENIAACGMHVILNARSEGTLEAMADQLAKEFNIQAIVIASDLSTQNGIDKVVEETKDIDVGLLVASAGFGTSGSFAKNTFDEEHAMLKVNCIALFQLTHIFSNRFLKRKKGAIVLLSSIISFQGAPYAAHYAATKAYVQTLAEGLYHELKSNGVAVLAVAPGPVHTGFAARANMQLDIALKPEQIALPILKAIGNQSTVIPGFLSKFLTYPISFLPRSWQVIMIKQVMKRMAI